MQRGPGQNRASPSPAERSPGSRICPGSGKRQRRSSTAQIPQTCLGCSCESHQGISQREPLSTLMMLACSTLDRIDISNVTFPSVGSSIQQSSRTFSFLINFTTTYEESRGGEAAPWDLVPTLVHSGKQDPHMLILWPQRHERTW